MRVKNWEKFQHYKSGRGTPPWVKLYRELLNDKEWFKLSGDASKFLISCWILAAESDGILPDSETLAWRLRIDIKTVEKHLSACNHWIIDDASNLLSTRYQDATPETEKETETEKEIEIPSTNVLCLASKTPNQQLIDLFHTKCGYLPKITVINESRKRTLKARYTEVMREEGWTPEKTLEWFSDFYEIVNQSKFLTGRAAAVNGHRVFRADWDWVHNPNNFVKIVEGKYNGG